MIVAVMYPNGAEAKFDHEYYITTHIPLLKDRWGPLGLKEVEVLRGTQQPDGSVAPFVAIALLRFGSVDEFKAASKAHGREIFSDIANFTDIKPIVQLNQLV
jgi:uncharacterized protein (TIGR02118 family)